MCLWVECILMGREEKMEANEGFTLAWDILKMRKSSRNFWSSSKTLAPLVVL